MTPPAPRTASAAHAPGRELDQSTDVDALIRVDAPSGVDSPAELRPPSDLDAPSDVDDEVDTDVAAAGPTRGALAAVPLDLADGLTERERQIIAFERQWWKHAGAKEQAIRDLFEVSSTRYYQMVNALLDNPAALAYDPVLIRRLRRLRATRTRSRARSA